MSVQRERVAARPLPLAREPVAQRLDVNNRHDVVPDISLEIGKQLLRRGEAIRSLSVAVMSMITRSRFVVVAQMPARPRCISGAVAPTCAGSECGDGGRPKDRGMKENRMIGVQRRGSLLAMLMAPSALWAQSATPPTRAASEIVGWVVDAVGKPIGDAEVLIAGTPRSTRSDARGVWRFTNPPTGPHVVLAREIGYVPYAREVIMGRATNDTLTLLLRRYPRTLSTVEVTARANAATASAVAQGERLIQMRVGAGRLYTRDYILETRPYSIAELVQGVPGMTIQRLRGNGTDGEVVATISRNRGGASGTQGVGNDGFSNPCPMQFFLDTSPIEGDQVGRLDPSMFRSVEVYPMNVVIPGLPQRGDRCGAIVINSFRR